MRDISGADFRFAKTLTLPFFGSGMVELPPGGTKRVKNSRKMQMVFFVFYGRVTVDLGTPAQRFSIGRGGMWQVPRGKPYFHAVFRVESLCAISLCNLACFPEVKRLSGLISTGPRSGPSEPKVAGTPTLYGHNCPRTKLWRIVLAKSCLNSTYQNTPRSTFAALAINIGPVSLFAQPDQASLTDFFSCHANKKSTGNFYSITNTSTKPARIFFAQGCEVASDSAGFDESGAA